MVLGEGKISGRQRLLKAFNVHSQFSSSVIVNETASPNGASLHGAETVKVAGELQTGSLNRAAEYRRNLCGCFNGWECFHLSRVLFPFGRTEGERVKEGGIAV